MSEVEFRRASDEMRLYRQARERRERAESRLVTAVLVAITAFLTIGLPFINHFIDGR